MVLHDSNRLTVHLQPCDVIARVAMPSARAGAELEVAVPTLLAETATPVAPLHPKVEPQVFDENSFVITLWAYCRPVPPADIGPREYAGALVRLHEGMREIDSACELGHFMDRVGEARGLVDDPATRRRSRPLIAIS